MMKNLANLITLSRTALAILILIFLNANAHFKLTAIFLIPITMIMDMFDGIAARKIQSDSTKQTLRNKSK